MTTEVVDVSDTRKEVKIEIPAETVKSMIAEVAGRYARSATVPGFRKGHAPTSVVRTRYKNDIQREVIQELIPAALGSVVEEASLNVIGEPDIHLDESVSTEPFGSVPLKAHVHIEVLPDFDLGKYKGIELVRRTRAIEDSDVDVVLGRLRENAASLLPVEDRGAEVGDTVTANFDGTLVDEPEAEHIKVDEVDIVLGDANVPSEFTDNLIGAKPDDERSFVMEYPADFGSPAVAGKKISYELKVVAVRRKELPELDDEFARSLGESYDSMEKVREEVRSDLEAGAKHEATERLQASAIEKLVVEHQFEVPESLIRHESGRMLRRFLSDLKEREVQLDSAQINWQEIGKSMKPRAEAFIKSSLVLDAIADTENIEVTDDEIQQEIAAVAYRSRRPIDEVRAALTKNQGESSIAEGLRSQKALRLVIENATITDEPWQEPEASAESIEQPADAETADENQNVSSSGQD